MAKKEKTSEKADKYIVSAVNDWTWGWRMVVTAPSGTRLTSNKSKAAAVKASKAFVKAIKEDRVEFRY